MQVTRRAGWSAMMVLSLVGCGGGEATPTPTSPTPPPAAPAPPAPTLTATVTISANNTFQPLEVTVLRGGRVTFVNQNNRAHDITSDPPHLHTDCPPVMEVGFIQPGQTKQTGVLAVAGTCGFHDHMQENNTDLRGRIIIQGTNP
jgi:plastocyanin